MDRKSIVLVVILAILVLGYWEILDFLGLKEKDPPKPAAQEQVLDSTPAEQSQFVEPATETPVAVTDSRRAESATQIPAADTVVADTIAIETERYSILLSSHGGGPVSIKLKEHSYRSGDPVEMLVRPVGASPDLSFQGNTFNTANLGFACSLAPGTYDVTGQPLEITYTWASGATEIRKHLVFYPDRYNYDLVVELINPESIGLERKYQIQWNTSPGISEPIPKVDYDAMEAVAMMSGSREKLDDFSDNTLNQSLEGLTQWAGVRNKYFSSVMIPLNRAAEQVSARGRKWEVSTPDGSLEKHEVTVAMEMPFIGSVTDSFTVFVGPMDYNLMSDYEVGLEDMLDIGTTPIVGWLIKPFAIGVMWLLPILYGFIPNYGFVIIIFAILVKLITLPLSLKSFKSMQAMKDIQPLTEQLKEKHKKNPQAMNAEMMKLYKKHGVNPMSGCLPMLPQMPLFFALFAVFRATILLRDAPFIGFISDLSHGASGLTDPYIILVVIMVGSQFLSQKLTMASTQQNKALMYMMPLMMGFLLYSLPSGLILYWTMFSLLSMLDYAVFKRDKNTQVQTT